MFNKRFKIKCSVSEGKIIISGVPRVEHHEEGELVLAEAKNIIQTHENPLIDIKELAFSNSAFLAVLARMIYDNKEKKIRIKAKEGSIWQRKTLETLQLQLKNITVKWEA